jgi:hypothetical protein
MQQSDLRKQVDVHLGGQFPNASMASIATGIRSCAKVDIIWRNLA